MALNYGAANDFLNAIAGTHTYATAALATAAAEDVNIVGFNVGDWYLLAPTGTGAAAPELRQAVSS